MKGGTMILTDRLDAIDNFTLPHQSTLMECGVKGFSRENYGNGNSTSFSETCRRAEWWQLEQDISFFYTVGTLFF